MVVLHCVRGGRPTGCVGAARHLAAHGAGARVQGRTQTRCSAWPPTASASRPRTRALTTSSALPRAPPRGAAPRAAARRAAAARGARRPRSRGAPHSRWSAPRWRPTAAAWRRSTCRPRHGTRRPPCRRCAGRRRRSPRGARGRPVLVVWAVGLRTVVVTRAHGAHACNASAAAKIILNLGGTRDFAHCGCCGEPLPWLRRARRRLGARAQDIAELGEAEDARALCERLGVPGALRPRFLALAVVPPDTPLPMAALAHLWRLGSLADAEATANLLEAQARAAPAAPGRACRPRGWRRRPARLAEPAGFLSGAELRRGEAIGILRAHRVMDDGAAPLAGCRCIWHAPVALSAVCARLG
jgi:hypothetical protein